MEKHGSPGCIYVSQEFYNSTRHAFTYHACGQVAIKGKGLMYTYHLLGKLR
jgi:hypothetical protein